MSATKKTCDSHLIHDAACPWCRAFDTMVSKSELLNARNEIANLANYLIDVEDAVATESVHRAEDDRQLGIAVASLSTGWTKVVANLDKLEERLTSVEKKFTIEPSAPIVKANQQSDRHYFVSSLTGGCVCILCGFLDEETRDPEDVNPGSLACRPDRPFRNREAINNLRRDLADQRNENQDQFVPGKYDTPIYWPKISEEGKILRLEAEAYVRSRLDYEQEAPVKERRRFFPLPTQSKKEEP